MTTRLTIFDLATLKPLGRVKTGTNPDAILYDALTQRVFVFNGRSGDVTVIDAKAGTVAATIPVGGKLEFGVTDGAGRIFVNVEDKNEIVALDARGMKVLAHWPLEGCEEPTGLAIDVAHKRLFAACGNKHMAVVDDDTGRGVATVPIGDGSDGAGFDPDAQVAFSSNGEGTLTVVHETTPDKFEVVQTVATQRERPHHDHRPEDPQRRPGRRRARRAPRPYRRPAQTAPPDPARILHRPRGGPVAGNDPGRGPRIPR